MECKITDATNTTGGQFTLLLLLFSPRLQILQRWRFLVVLLVFDDLPTIFASLTHGCRGGLRHFLTPIFHPLCFAELLLNFKPDCGPTLASYHLWLHCIRNTTETNNNTPRNLATHTCTHPFNGPLYGTTWVSWYQKGQTNLDFTEARDSEWQWQQLGHMQVCTSRQTDNHTSTPPLSFYRPDALPAAQPTVSKHWNLANLKTKYQTWMRNTTNQT